MLRNRNGPDARPYGKELIARGLHADYEGTWKACNHNDHRQGGRVWLVNHDSDANTDDRIEQMIDDHGDAFDRMVLPSRADVANIPERGVPAWLWSTNPSGVVAYEVC